MINQLLMNLETYLIPKNQDKYIYLKNKFKLFSVKNAVFHVCVQKRGINFMQ